MMKLNTSELKNLNATTEAFNQNTLRVSKETLDSYNNGIKQVDFYNSDRGERPYEQDEYRRKKPTGTSTVNIMGSYPKR